MPWRATARRQLGLVTRSQLLAAGLTSSRVQSLITHGDLTAAHRGVYRLTGAPVTLDQRRLAGVLGVAGAALSHRAAAGVWGAGPFAMAEPELVVDVGRSGRLAGVTVHRSRSLPSSDVIRKGPLPRITRPSRTLIDVANLPGIGDSTLEEVAADLLLGWPGERPRLLRALERMRAHPQGAGADRLRAILGDYLLDGRRPPHPGLERRLLALVRESDLLPPPAVHLHIRTPVGVIEVDLAWPDVQLALEADSARWHSSPANLRTDRQRDQALAMVGWQTLRTTWEQVRDTPDEVVARVAVVRERRATQLATGSSSPLVTPG